MADQAPRVFISYSHDSEEHKAWVLNFASRLRVAGVDAVLDQWDLKPGKDITLFMEEQLSVCDFAILICTQRYVEKADSGNGGVGYERMIVSSELVKEIDSGKFIPITRERGENSVPKFIETKFRLEFSDDEYFETVFDDLLRAIFGAEISTKPPLGEAQKFTADNSTQVRSVARTKTGLSVEAYEVFERLVREYDQGASEGFRKVTLAGWLDFGQITLDAALYELNAADLVWFDRITDYVELTKQAAPYAKKIGMV
jgi:hypothetical protein